MANVLGAILLVASIPVALSFDASLLGTMPYSVMRSQFAPAKSTPCCVDMLSSGVCRALYQRNQEGFVNACRQNADFSFLQCCNTCHFYEDEPLMRGRNSTELYNLDVYNLLLHVSEETETCFDRHSSHFCRTFIDKEERWSQRQVTCTHAALAFRICRKTCGYCSSWSSQATVEYDSKKARDMKLCAKLF
ncbi:hypothetical protein QR680_017322 [Steinernema hermaphroditum]|uniref:ShKT domain-containing protein n=1 Tax=Steinernema hermaphroditum TaxID=289476 RepID=A0AA39HF59_9BILA|nr:hypothetical protein QR680_017322 [Steinernema hermaphroditum]